MTGARNNPADSNSAAGCVLFFVHLQQDKSELLDFRSTGDQWQVVALSVPKTPSIAFARQQGNGRKAGRFQLRRPRFPLLLGAVKRS
jgi:hypothetical protein